MLLKVQRAMSDHLDPVVSAVVTFLVTAADAKPT